jgi:hypothetical protein
MVACDRVPWIFLKMQDKTWFTLHWLTASRCGKERLGFIIYYHGCEKIVDECMQCVASAITEVTRLHNCCRSSSSLGREGITIFVTDQADQKFLYDCLQLIGLLITNDGRLKLGHLPLTLVFETGLGNPIAVWVWTKSMGRFGSRPVQKPESEHFDWLTPYTYLSTRGFCQVSLNPSGRK